MTTEANHGSGDKAVQPSPLEQHRPASQQTEEHPDSISLPQTPETAARVVGLNDSDHPDIAVGNMLADPANDTPRPPGPHIQPWDSPPRRESRRAPSPPPASGPGDTPTRRARTTAWLDSQGRPPIGLGLSSYPLDMPGAVGGHAFPAPEGPPRDSQEEPAGAKKDVATSGGGQALSGKE